MKGISLHCDSFSTGISSNMAEAKRSFLLILFASVFVSVPFSAAGLTEGGARKGRRAATVIELEGGSPATAWVVQLSDLHFSVFHPERAYDFRRYIAPALAMVNPALVLITGDLTDGESKDSLTMKQDESEWIEYQNVIEDVVERSNLSMEIFYDLRGNHDSSGVPEAGGTYDYYQKYSINARLRRKGNVHSITLQNQEWRYLFVGFDSTMEIGVRGPTNAFGHPTDNLLDNLNMELSQWDTEPADFPVTKISFGHFPLSFSASTDSGKNLIDLFLEHSLSAYICGHLHTSFGNNLKRHHQSHSQGKYYQLNIHERAPINISNKNCSSKAGSIKEFWEWELGDWRESRAMRIIAIDSGHVSYVDIDFKLGSKEVIILPTFPLDSRFMQRISSFIDYKCQTGRESTFDTIRTLVFAKTEILSVLVKIYDTQYETPSLVLDSSMKRVEGDGSRGSIYTAIWNWRAFVDPSPNRYWLQIEAILITGESSYSQLRPFSVNGLTANVKWKWKEFFVMGCQWASLYQPSLWSILSLLFSLLLVPQILLRCWMKNYTYQYISPSFRGKHIWEFSVHSVLGPLVELAKVTNLWLGMLLYLLYLLFFPWFFGHVFTERGEVAYMTYRGWVLPNSNRTSWFQNIDFPDVMVIVIPHLCFVVLPTILVMAAMSAERAAFRRHYLSLSGKKKDDGSKDDSQYTEKQGSFSSRQTWNGHWERKVLLLLNILILWKHWEHCRALVKAYDMDPIAHSPVYCFMVPVLLANAIYKTSAV